MDDISYETYCLKEYLLNNDKYAIVIMQIASDLMSNGSYVDSINSLSNSIREVVMADLEESLKEASNLSRQLAFSSFERIDFKFIAEYIISIL